MERKELSGTQKALAELERYRVIADYYLKSPLSALEEKNRKRLQEIREYIFAEGKNLNSRIFYEKSKEVIKILNYVNFLNNIQFL